MHRRHFLAALAASFAACRRAAAPPPARLTLAGSSTIQPLCEVAAQAYEHAHTGVQINVQGGGSGVGVTSARSGLADIGMVSRALKPEEADLTATSIAFDGIAVIVHASNPLTNITRAQVIDLYTGAAANWSALGAPSAPVTVINKEEGRSTLELFEHHFGLRGRFVRNAIIIGPNGQAITTVAGNPNAVAYVSIGSATAAIAQGTPIKLLALDGTAATVENVRNGSFPLRRPLNLVTRAAPTGLAASFIAFVRSPEGQRLVASQDFVPL